MKPFLDACKSLFRRAERPEVRPEVRLAREIDLLRSDAYARIDKLQTELRDTVDQLNDARGQGDFLVASIERSLAANAQAIRKVERLIERMRREPKAKRK